MDKFPPDTVTVVRDTTLFHDTVIYRTLIGDTVYQERVLYRYIPSICDYEPIQVETDLCSARSWVVKDKIKLRLIQRDSIFRFRLDSAISANKTEIVKTKIIEKQLPPKPFYKIGFWIVLSLFLLTITGLILRR